MAGYPSFVVRDNNTRQNVYVTQSAKKAYMALTKGRRIEIWVNGDLLIKIYSHEKSLMDKFLEDERRFHAEKQKRAEARWKRGWA